MRKAVARVAVLSALLTLAVSSTAWAHVEISPESASPGGAETFTAEVPTEKDVPTTGVRLQVPEGFSVTGVEAPEGWRGGLEGNSITFSGGEIGEDEVQEFTFEASTPDQAGEFAWKTYQTYQDGSVVAWTGSPDSDAPAPVVEIAQSGGAASEVHTHGVDDSHAAGEGLHSEATLPDSGGISPIVIILGVVAVGCLAVGVWLLARGRG